MKREVPRGVFLHRRDIADVLRALASARPDWLPALEAVAIGLGVELHPEPYLITRCRETIEEARR